MSVQLRLRYSSVSVNLVFAIGDAGSSDYLRLHFTKCIVDRTSGKPNMTLCDYKEQIRYPSNQYSRIFFGLKPKQEYYFSVYAESRAGQPGPKRGIFYISPELESKFVICDHLTNITKK